MQHAALDDRAVHAEDALEELVAHEELGERAARGELGEGVDAVGERLGAALEEARHPFELRAVGARLELRLTIHGGSPWS